MKAPALILALTALVLPIMAHAAPPFAYRMVMTPEEGPVDQAVQARYTPAFTACQDKAQTTLDNADCFVAEFTRQDAALNRAWQAVFPKIAPAQQPLLRAAQRRWIAARDPFCRKESDGFSGGTIAPVLYVNCRVEQTIRRTLWLENLAKG
ncbi:hypothetical protein NSE01_18370 [Novosphingobium sediminis]|uniref:Lysozyme inhibitor LprI-like N-terminal domain-containing protein n=1 Tax=Novosphingobium sediminis TaxID=707214 RepID=A0A512AJY4_9SPHN|nr:lysozyme inhibitor LprI family protein [Novosphingobium sediminis]GEO00005.1 hypothetical protein NSE01_18370 [Novosphingobium sediminis]